jgi:hypothetical protein
VDSTLNRAALDHEVGERMQAINAKQKGIHLHASHLGVEPILRENQIARGDPEAVGTLQKLRHQHPDDKLVNKMTRQLGHHPDSPLPVGGRHQRKLEKMLEDSSSKLAPHTKGKIVGQQLANDALGTGVDIKTLSEAGRNASKDLVARGRALKPAFQQLKAAPTWAGARNVFSQARQALPSLGALYRAGR